MEKYLPFVARHWAPILATGVGVWAVTAALRRRRRRRTGADPQSIRRRTASPPTHQDQVGSSSNVNRFESRSWQHGNLAAR